MLARFFPRRITPKQTETLCKVANYVVGTGLLMGQNFLQQQHLKTAQKTLPKNLNLAETAVKTLKR